MDDGEGIVVMLIRSRSVETSIFSEADVVVCWMFDQIAVDQI